MKGVFGQQTVETNHYVVGKFTFSEDTKEEHHHIHGVFNNLDEANDKLADILPNRIWSYADDQYYIHKERYEQILAVYPDMALAQKEDMGNSWFIQYVNTNDFPLVTREQRLKLADLCGHDFETSYSGERYYIHRVALVPVEVIK